MTDKEFNLSEKIYQNGVIPMRDIKEFIKRLKENCFNNEELQGCNQEICREIDKLAGAKLSGGAGDKLK